MTDSRAKITCPEFAIITASYNKKQELLNCLDSVSRQTYPHVRHTVIDGGSTDGSPELLKTKADLYYWHSKKDAGIADAFNMGLQHSKGNVILFLGADDRLFDQDVLTDCAAFLQHQPRPWFLYGDIVYEYDTCSRFVKKNYSWKRFCMYDCLPHQALFVDRWFFEKYGEFEKSYKITMDYEHISRFIKEFQPIYWPRTVSAMRRSGLSSEPIATHREMDRVKKEHNLASPASRFFFFYGIVFFYFFKCRVLKQRWS